MLAVSQSYAASFGFYLQYKSPPSFPITPEHSKQALKRRKATEVIVLKWWEYETYNPMLVTYFAVHLSNNN